MRTHAPWLVLGPIVLALVGACSTPAPSSSPAAPSTTVPTPSPDGVAADLAALLRALDTVHPNAFHGISREEFVVALEDYAQRLPKLSEAEAVVQLMRVNALLSREGRDGHQFTLPQPGHEAPVLPIRIYEFSEGVFVTDAAPGHEDLIGARITAIGGTPIDDVLELVEPLVPRDSEATVPTFRPVHLLRTEVLVGLGIIDEGSVALDVELPDGGADTATIEPMPFDDYVAWAGNLGMIQLPADERVTYLANPSPITVGRLDDETAYIRYRAVIRPDVSAATALLTDPSVTRLVLDLRQNPGGDNTTYGPLLSLVTSFAESHPGRLAVLIDRVTFSAAANLATEIEQATDATFVGEPMGGGLNFWDDVRQVHLDHLPVPMMVGVSTRYWQFAPADDPRLTIGPSVPVTVSASDYFAGRDPALDAAMAVGD